MDERQNFKTEFQTKLEARDRAIYQEYMSLVADGVNSKTQVKLYLMRKYGLHSPSVINKAIKKFCGQYS